MGDLLFGGPRFILDKVPFDADFFGRFQDGRNIHLAGAKGGVVIDIGFAGQEAGGRSFFHVLQVHQFPAAGIFKQQLDGVLARMNDPEDVHLIVNEAGIGFGHEQIEQGAFAVRLKFIPMGMVKEFDAMLGESNAGAIEDGGGFAAGLFVEITLVGDPGAAGIFQAEGLGVVGDPFDIVAKAFEWEMAADRFDAALEQFRFEGGGGQLVGAGQFSVFDSELFDFVEGAGDVFVELNAQAVKLETDGPLEAWSETSGGGAASGDSQGEEGNETSIIRFHGVLN